MVEEPLVLKYAGAAAERTHATAHFVFLLQTVVAKARAKVPVLPRISLAAEYPRAARLRAAPACPVSCGPALARGVAPPCGPPFGGPIAVAGPNDTTTFSARRGWLWCRRARPVARRVLCAAPDAARCALCACPDAVQLARFAGPVSALSQTSPHLRAASWPWRVQWRFGLQLATPSELKTKRSLQMQSRIQEKRERSDEKPV